MLADPSDLESLVPEFRNARKRNRETEDRMNRHRKRLATTHEDQECHILRAEQSQPSFPSHTIRIFDADEEKTPYFRKRVLPGNFLNSQVMNKHSETIRPRGNSPRQTLSKDLPSSSPKRKTNDLDFSPPLPVNFHERNASRGSLGVRLGRAKMPQLRPTSPLPSSVLDSFAHRRPVVGDRRPLVRAPPRSMKHHFRSPHKPFAYMERRIPETPEFVARAPVRESPSSRSPRHREEFSPSVDHMFGMSSGTRFPAVEAGSYSSSLISHQEVEQKCKEFRSLLADEEMKCDDFSAEVQQIEMKLLGEPDIDVRTFQTRNRRTAKKVPGFKSETKHEIPNARTRNQFEAVSLTMGDVSVPEVVIRVPSDEKCSGERDVFGIENTDIDMKDTERKSYPKDVEIELIATERNPIKHAREQSPSSMR